MRRPCGQIIAGFCGLWGTALALLCASGCASHRGSAAWQAVPPVARDEATFATAKQTVLGAFPSLYQATQRAIITVRRRQFVCDGFLTVSPENGWHLAVVSPLGLVTDVRVKGDGSGEVLKVTPLFQEKWAREYVCRELRWLFMPPSGLAPAGRLSDGRLLLEAESPIDGLKARYACSRDGSRWEELEVLNGPRRLFHAKACGYRSFPGWPRAVPAEIEVKAGTHELHVLIAALSMAAAVPREGAR
jgi:hypothetical protein